ncbi:MAG: PH domain-containing protein [Thermomicrobiales bacterium]|nr:PH domain-containing protein [Thermomicrobiales bacterium]
MSHPDDQPVQPVAAAGSELRTLDPRKITAWRIELGLVAAVILAMLIGGAAVIITVADRDLLLWLGAALLVLILIAASIVWYAPLLEWRFWRYAIRENEVEIRSGIWQQTKALIPMSRVQYVDVRQDLIDRRLGLATVMIATAGGSREIPGIAAADAEPLRNRIAALANIHDDL